MARKIRKFLIEVKNVKPCAGGYSCILSANGRKVLFMAPEIFEWTAGHSTRNDLLEFWADKHSLGKSEPTELPEGWMTKEPMYKNDLQDKSERHLKEWMERYLRKYVKAKAVYDLCKKIILTKMRNIKEPIHYPSSPSIFKTEHDIEMWKRGLLPGEILLNGLTIDELMEVL